MGNGTYVGASDLSLSTPVLEVHLSYDIPPMEWSQHQESVQEMEVSAHPSCCAQTKTSHTSHLLGDDPFPPLSCGRGLMLCQLVPAACPLPSGAAQSNLWIWYTQFQILLGH